MNDGDGNANEVDDDTPKISMALIEKIVKGYKSHRNAVDFEYGFVNNLLGDMKKIGKNER